MSAILTDTGYILFPFRFKTSYLIFITHGVHHTFMLTHNKAPYRGAQVKG